MKVQLSIDRLEGETAVLVGETGGPIELPISFLPNGAKAGDVLSFSLEIDSDATAVLQREARELQNDLTKRDPGGDLEL